MRSSVKIKPSQNGVIILSFTDIGKSCPGREIYNRHKYVTSWERADLLALVCGVYESGSGVVFGIVSIPVLCTLI